MKKYKDPDAFIFSLKNPHNITTTRYMSRKESEYDITCNFVYGPIFGDSSSSDMAIYCKNSKCISLFNNDCSYSYYCDSHYKSLLFTNSTSANIFDYEVYNIDYLGKETIYTLCKYPDIIWEYIQTNDISKESLQLAFEIKKVYYMI